jgi:alkylation response protein AidB-like acyl-CoA dehydrogenase
MQRLAEIGVLGMALPQEYGGSGLIVGAKPFNLDNLAFTLSTKAQLGRTTPGVVPNLKSVLEEVGEVSGKWGRCQAFVLLYWSCLVATMAR